MCVLQVLHEISTKFVIYSFFIVNKIHTYAHKDDARKHLHSCMSIGICSAFLNPLTYIMIFGGLGMTDPHAIHKLLHYLMVILFNSI